MVQVGATGLAILEIQRLDTRPGGLLNLRLHQKAGDILLQSLLVRQSSEVGLPGMQDKLWFILQIAVYDNAVHQTSKHTARDDPYVCFTQVVYAARLYSMQTSPLRAFM